MKKPTMKSKIRIRNTKRQIIKLKQILSHILVESRPQLLSVYVQQLVCPLLYFGKIPNVVLIVVLLLFISKNNNYTKKILSHT